MNDKERRELGVSHDKDHKLDPEPLDAPPGGPSPPPPPPPPPTPRDPDE